MSVLSVAQVDEAGLADWRLLRTELRTRLRTGNWAKGMALLNAISEAAEQADHHPDIGMHWGFLDVALTSHDVGGVTGRDVRMARRISALAAEADVPADPSALSVVEVGLDTPDAGAVQAFWAAALGADASSDEVRDPAGVGPTLWFQPSGAVEPRQRFHLDVMLPAEVVQSRIEAAVAAGGRIVSTADAPRFVVLADPDGNHVCLCTMQGR